MARFMQIPELKDCYEGMKETGELGNLEPCPVCGGDVRIVSGSFEFAGLFEVCCNKCAYESGVRKNAEVATLAHNNMCALIAEHLAPTSERDAARARVAELEAENARLRAEVVGSGDDRPLPDWV